MHLTTHRSMRLTRHQSIHHRVAGLVAVALIVLAAGCASSGASAGGATTPETTLVRGARSTLAIDTRRENEERVDSLPVSPQQLFGVLPQVLASLTLRTATLDQGALRIASAPTQFRRTIDGERLSHFISCGVTAMGNNADLYSVTLRVQSWVERAGETASVLHTVVRATARPNDNGSGSSVNCASNGKLEGRVRALAVLKVMETR